MANIAKIEFPALNITGENYMPWTAHVKRHLKSMGVLETLTEWNECSDQDKAKADVFLHKHIDEMLQFEYSNFEDPYVLWEDLKSRFDNQREVLLPTARDEWNNLRFQDFKKVNEYTSALYRICSTLRFCGQTVTEEDMLEKTFSTFHASNINLQQQYRLQKFQRYSDLNSFLLVAEKNNELLMKNHQARPTGSLAIPEANAVINDDTKDSGRKWGRGHGRGHFGKSNGRNYSFKRNNNFRSNSHGRGRGRGRGRARNQRTPNYHTPQNTNSNQYNKRNEAGRSENNGTSCFRCGSANHWSKACRTPSHLCELYQASLKRKEKEMNHVDNFNDINVEMNVADFNNNMEL
ncbi:putative transcription factor interactor and regulator CCHC(Zn) family [Helianthus annuus]|nr:putative transcription factor interactor and regulator CCHC(Zn) family [Helianthus annuus]